MRAGGYLTRWFECLGVLSTNHAIQPRGYLQSILALVYLVVDVDGA
jgi:hypothetical protein